MKWISRNDAKKIQEGVPVLKRVPGCASNEFDYEVENYFRPDWIKFDSIETEYCILEKAK